MGIERSGKTDAVDIFYTDKAQILSTPIPSGSWCTNILAVKGKQIPSLGAHPELALSISHTTSGG